jgi:hypothetical protein
MDRYPPPSWSSSQNCFTFSLQLRNVARWLFPRLRPHPSLQQAFATERAVEQLARELDAEADQRGR